MVRAGRLLKILGVVLIAAVAGACLCLVLPKIAGFDTYVVVSGSMEPAIPVGSLVYSKEADPATLSEGDVIVFKTKEHGDTPITHRVVSNDTAKGIIITKGDANAHEDAEPLMYENVVGRVVAHVPRVGFIAAMLASTLGRIVAGLLLIEGWFLIEIGRRQSARG